MTMPIRGAPSISVVIPLFNKAPYVAEAIRSVVQQRLAAAEIVVVDDGSTDGGAQIVMALALPQLRLIGQANGGVAVARNRGIEAARGDFIAFLDADDRYLPGYLDGIGRLIAAYPAAGLYCSAYTGFRADGSRLTRRLPGVAPGGSLLVEDFHRAWSRCSFTFTSAIVVRRALFDDATLRFPPGEALGEDHDMWLRLAERAPVAYLDDALVEYRMGVAGSATQAQAVTAVLPCYGRLHERLRLGRVPPRLRRGAQRLLASHVLNIARTHLRLGNLGQARAFASDRRALGNPAYLVRTLLRIVAAGMGAGRRA